MDAFNKAFPVPSETSQGVQQGVQQNQVGAQVQGNPQNSGVWGPYMNAQQIYAQQNAQMQQANIAPAVLQGMVPGTPSMQGGMVDPRNQMQQVNPGAFPVQGANTEVNQVQYQPQVEGIRAVQGEQAQIGKGASTQDQIDAIDKMFTIEEEQVNPLDFNSVYGVMSQTLTDALLPLVDSSQDQNVRAVKNIADKIAAVTLSASEAAVQSSQARYDGLSRKYDHLSGVVKAMSVPGGNLIPQIMSNMDLDVNAATKVARYIGSMQPSDRTTPQMHNIPQGAPQIVQNPHQYTQPQPRFFAPPPAQNYAPPAPPLSFNSNQNLPAYPIMDEGQIRAAKGLKIPQSEYIASMREMGGTQYGYGY